MKVDMIPAKPVYDVVAHQTWNAKIIVDVLTSQMLAIMPATRGRDFEDMVVETLRRRGIQDEVEAQTRVWISTTALFLSAESRVLLVDLTFRHPFGRVVVWSRIV